MSSSNALTAGSLRLHDAGLAENLFQLGLNCFLHGDYQAAAGHLSAALKRDPANAALYGQRGEVFRLLCDYERAIADFTSALRLGAANPVNILVNRAMAFHRQGEHARAVADCGAALDLDPSAVAAFRTRAAAHAELSSPDQALADLTRAQELAPRDGDVFYERGAIHARNGAFDLAIADFDQAIARNPYRVSAYFERAHAYRAGKNYVQAIHDYTEVLRHQPNHVLAYANRGLCFKRQGERDRAIADFSEALRLDVTTAQNFYQRGILYRARGDLVRAEADLDEAIRLQPENWAAGYHRAKVFLAQGRLLPAIEDLNQVLDLNPKLVVGYLSRALTKDRIGRSREALADSTHAVKLETGLAAAHLVRGVVHAHREEYVAAVADLSRAIQLDERLAPAYCERGLAYTFQGDYERALADCDRFLALEPANARAYAQRSIVYHFKGQVEEALADYAQALRIDPRCVLSGLNQSLADSVRSQSTLRLADYIDGILPESSAAEAPLPTDFRIVLEPNDKNPRKETVIEYEIEEVLDDGPAKNTVTSETAPTPVGCPLCHHFAVPEETLDGGRVRCGNCNALFVPAGPETARPAARPNPPTAAAARKSAKKPKSKQADDVEEPSILQKCKKPLPMAVAGVLLLAAIYLFFPRNLYGVASHVPVFAAHGTVTFQGKITPGATVFLHPVGTKDASFPTPRAVIKEDGTFILGTYGEDDGAPAGEYRATVQWFKKVEDPEKNDSVVPQNQLPAKYARADTSGLNVLIQDGDNKLSTLQLKR